MVFPKCIIYYSLFKSVCVCFYLPCFNYQLFQVLLMEECTQSLGDFIESFSKDYGAFSPPTIYQVVASVSRALQYLHEDQKLIHGDIKSFNVLIKGYLFIFSLSRWRYC